MGRHSASTMLRVRLSPRAKDAWHQAVLLERAIGGKSAGQMLASAINHRRESLLKLARARGIDVETILKPRAKPPKAMPESIDRIDPFI